MVGDGTWLSTGEVVDRYRVAGYADSESTIRRELDDAIARGEIEVYRTRGQYRRVRASDVRAFIAVKHLPRGPERDHRLGRLRRAEPEEGSVPPQTPPGQ